jgi:hypothetical protein
LEARREAEIKRIERRKDSHIAELMKSHEKAFGEIKNYYNDITHNNLDLIKSLKEEVEYMFSQSTQNKYSDIHSAACRAEEEGGNR